MSNVLIPPTFSGDYFSSLWFTQSTLVDFGEFSVIQGSGDRVLVDIDRNIVYIADLFIVVRPSLLVYSLEGSEPMMIRQAHGRPMVHMHRGYAQPDHLIPLLAFGGWVKDKWLRFTFRRNPHSLSDYGWISESTEENPLTPEWESFILSHGQEISHA